MSRVAVIGAGVGGLAAAVRLASAGHAVTVLEQSDAIGGKLGILEAGGFTWDTGPSLLTMPHILEETFAAAGGRLEDVLSLRRLDPIAHYRFADGTTLAAAADLDEFCDRLDAVLEPGSGDDWRKLSARAAEMWRVVEEPFLRSPVGLAELARQSLRLRDLPVVAPQQTLRSLGRTYLRDPRLRMFLDRYATYTGSDPRRAPATLAVIPYIEQRFGGWYVDGGLHRIAAALAVAAQQHGAVIRTGADVTRIATSGRDVAGVELAGGERIAADVVVANADAATVYRDLLPPSVGAGPLRRLRRAVPSLSGFVLLLGVGGDVVVPAHHSVSFPADYDAEFDAIFGSRPEPVGDPTIYISAPDDPAAAPVGQRSWFVLVNAPRSGPVAWTDDAASQYAGHLLQVLAERGVDLTGRIVEQQLLSPADLQQRTRADGGAIYGTSSNGMRSAFLRPSNATGIRGLFLVGGSSHPGGGLPLVLLSAGIVAELVGGAR